MITSFNMQDHNITMVRGDTLSFGVEIVDQYGAALDINAAYFTCKANPLSSSPTFQKTLGSGIEQDSTGKYTVRVSPTDTSSLAVGRYYYDFVVERSIDTFTIMRGVLEILQNVT